MLIWVANQMCGDWAVTICVYYSNTTNYFIDPRINIDYLNISREKTNKLFSFIETEVSLLKYFKKQKNNIIVSFGDLFSMILVRILKRYGRVVVCDRGDPAWKQPFGFNKWRMSAFRYADACVFQSCGAMNRVSYDIKGKSHIIPNPIHISSLCHRHEGNRKEISFVARFDIKQKRQDVALNAFQLINAKHPDYKLVFYGDGEDLELIKNSASILSCKDMIEFKGRCEDVIESIVDSYMFLLTSDFEGIPNSLLEALSIGLPCVSTDCTPGGADLLLDGGKYGILVEKGNVKAIADAINYLIENQVVAYDLGQKARKSCERFEPEVIANKWKECFEQISLD